MNRILRLGGTMLTAAALLVASACDDDPSGVDDSGRMTVAFSAAGSGSATLQAGALASAAGPNDVVVTGTNGTLTITDVAFIVGEFKLDRTESACDDLEGDDDDDDCEEFETGTHFVVLPLTGSATSVLTASVPSGTYAEMKFEVEDANAESGDDDADMAALHADIAAAGYSDWPENASLAVSGTFDPLDGDARAFVAYFDAEIRIEMEFDPPLVIDGAAGTVDIEVDPSAWFAELDGTVVDLSAFDYTTTGEVLEFEAKMEDGFTKIELEGFDD